MVDVTVNYSASSACGTPVCTLKVTANEPAIAPRSGNTSPGWIVIDPHHVQLRAERAGTGTGRIYTIAITCTAANTSSQQSTQVTVAH